MKEIYYLNHLNKELNLLKLPYRLQTGDFYDYTWDYISTVNISRVGGKITRFDRGIAEKNLRLSIQAKTKQEYYDALNYFLEVTETDILYKRPGRLYIGEQYIKCYLIESKKTLWEGNGNVLDCNIKLVTEYPFWATENKYTFLVQEVISSDNKTYPGKYAYRYANGLTDKTITNNHFAPSDMKINIYGPVINPLIIIGSKTYQVNTILIDGEYLEIDTARKTIYKVQNNGNRVNMFNSRNKEHDVFAKIEPGVQPISWEGTFAFDVTIYEERSEPKWIL